MATECIVKIIFVIIVSQPHSNCLGQKISLLETTVTVNIYKVCLCTCAGHMTVNKKKTECKQLSS